MNNKKLILNLGSGNPNKSSMAKPYPEALRLDIDPTTDPDVVASIYDLPYESNTVDVIILESVLEHLEHPEDAVAECARVLKHGGKLIGWAPFIYPFHAKTEHYGDFFRYSHQGLHALLYPYGTTTITPSAGYFETVCILVPFVCSFRRFFRWLDRVTKFDTNICAGHTFELNIMKEENNDN